MQKITSVILGVAAFASAVYATPTKVVNRGYYTTNVLGMYPNSGNPAPPPSATQTVHVGGSAGLVFTPEFIMCDVGTVVEFQFDVKNHTLTQSTFPEPCVGMSNGVDSGFMPSDGTNLPSFQMTVMSSDPLWFYCKQGNHCQQGMVFAVNPPTSGPKTFQQYKMNAMGQGTSTVIATSTMDCTSSAPPSMMYPQPPPTGTMMPGWNAGTDGECQCVCNVDLANGAVNNLQGINGFGGQLGNVQIPWGVSGAFVPPPPSSSEGGYPQPSDGYGGGDNGNSGYNGGDNSGWSGSSDPGSYTPPAVMSDSATSTVGNVANVGVGTVVPLGTDTDNSNVAPQETGSSSSPGTQDSSNPPSAPPGGFVSDGQLGGAAGKV